MSHQIKQIMTRPDTKITTGTVQNTETPGSGQPIQTINKKGKIPQDKPLPVIPQKLAEIVPAQADVQFGEFLGGDAGGANFTQIGDTGILLTPPANFIHRRIYAMAYAKFTAAPCYYRFSLNCYRNNNIVAKFPLVIGPGTPLAGTKLSGYVSAFTSMFYLSNQLNGIGGQNPALNIISQPANSYTYVPLQLITALSIWGLIGGGVIDVLYPKNITLAIDKIQLNCDSILNGTDCRGIVVCESFSTKQT
jgi:hypothetical protein